MIRMVTTTRGILRGSDHHVILPSHQLHFLLNKIKHYEECYKYFLDHLGEFCGFVHILYISGLYPFDTPIRTFQNYVFCPILAHYPRLLATRDNGAWQGIVPKFPT